MTTTAKRGRLRSEGCRALLLWRRYGVLCFVFITASSALAQTKQVYILTGQSNSLGTTSLEGPAEEDWGPGTEATDAQTEFFWSNVSPSNSVYPPAILGDSAGVFTTLQIQQGEGANPAFWGPEFGFARRLHETGRSDFVVIKASRGGGGNSLWDKATFEANNNAGHMWGHVRNQVDLALGALQGSGTDFEIRGLMYLQGESNGTAEALAADNRLRTLVDNLKLHIETSYPGVTDNWHTVIGEIAASGATGNRQTTTTNHRNLAASNDDYSFVPTADLPLKSDGIHFGRDAKRTIGVRFADEFIAQLEQPNDVLGDVNQNGVLFGDGTGTAEGDDVTAFIENWRTATAGLTNLDKTKHGDLNLDGLTDLRDAMILHRALAAQGAQFPFQLLGNQVPEPTSSALFVVGGLTSLLTVKLSRAATR